MATTFIDRLKEEHQQLFEKIDKLTLFLKVEPAHLPQAQIDLLDLQLQVMQTYATILQKRLRLLQEGSK